MDHVVIYENEALLLKDSLKKEIRETYKNCGVTITLAIENKILQGVHVSIRVVNIKEGSDKYISVNGLYNYKDYYDFIMCTIKDELNKIFQHYIKRD